MILNKKWQRTKCSLPFFIQYRTKGIQDNHSRRLFRIQNLRSSPEVRLISQFKYFNSLEKSLINSARATRMPTNTIAAAIPIQTHCAAPISIIFIILTDRKHRIDHKRNHTSKHHSQNKHQHPKPSPLLRDCRLFYGLNYSPFTGNCQVADYKIRLTYTTVGRYML